MEFFCNYVCNNKFFTICLKQSLYDGYLRNRCNCNAFVSVLCYHTNNI